MTNPVQLPERELLLKRIVVTTDFSNASRCAMPYAQALAERYGSQLTFLHVIDREELRFGPQETAAQLRVVARSEAERNLRDWDAAALIKSPHKNIILEGDFSEAISGFVHDQHIDLVVTGTRGASGLDRLALGSKAEEILRSSKCPVITVGPEGVTEAERHVRFATVLFATDFTRHSLAAVPYVVSLTRKFGGRVLALHMVHQDVQSVAERLHLRRRYDEAMRALFPSDLCDWIEPVVDFGHLETAVCEIAQFEKVDLIVLGVKGGGELSRAITHFGQSTTGKILAEAPCPVLTIRGEH